MDRSSKEVSTPEQFIEALKACKFVFLNIIYIYDPPMMTGGQQGAILLLG